MGPDLWSFITWQFILFSLGVMTIVFILRTILQYFFIQLQSSRLWNTLVLPVAPILIGGTMARLLKAYPYSTGLTSNLDHILFGAVAGLLSGLIFSVIKGTLGSSIQALVSSLGIPIPPSPPTGTTTSTDDTIPTNLPPRGQ
jgi:hypothetical protein